MRVLYMEQAQKMEAAGSLLEAEKLYLQVGEVRRQTGRGGGAGEDRTLVWFSNNASTLKRIPGVRCGVGYSMCDDIQG